MNNLGPDSYHDAFKCTANGVYDTPSDEDDPPREWPACKNQSDSKTIFSTDCRMPYQAPSYFSLYLSVIVTAVEIMLDKFDRKISDRFKIIGYKDDDNAKLVSSLPNHISNVAVPVALGRRRT